MYNSKKNIKMNDKNKAPFKVEDVNWDELSGIGILKDELEQAGELETLLRGEKTGVVEQNAEGIMLNEQPAVSAKQGDYISLKTDKEVRRGDKVYKEVKR